MPFNWNTIICLLAVIVIVIFLHLFEWQLSKPILVIITLFDGNRGNEKRKKSGKWNHKITMMEIYELGGELKLSSLQLSSSSWWKRSLAILISAHKSPTISTIVPNFMLNIITRAWKTLWTFFIGSPEEVSFFLVGFLTFMSLTQSTGGRRLCGGRRWNSFGPFTHFFRPNPFMPLRNVSKTNESRVAD